MNPEFKDAAEVRGETINIIKNIIINLIDEAKNEGLFVTSYKFDRSVVKDIQDVIIAELKLKNYRINYTYLSGDTYYIYWN